MGRRRFKCLIIPAGVNEKVSRTISASLGLLPAALSRGIGSDSQRPFAIVIVGGLVAALILGVYLLPTLYVWVAGRGDALPVPEKGYAEE